MIYSIPNGDTWLTHGDWLSLSCCDSTPTSTAHRNQLRLHLRRLGLLRPQAPSETPDIKMPGTAGDAPLRTELPLEWRAADAPHRPSLSELEHTFIQNRSRAKWWGHCDVLTPNFIFATRETDLQMHVNCPEISDPNYPRVLVRRREPVSCGYVQRCAITESD